MKDLLDKQVQIYSVDTGNFYSKKEAQLHWLNHKLRIERKKLIDGYTETSSDGKSKRKIIGRKEIEQQLLDFGIDEDILYLVENNNYDFDAFHEDNAEVVESLCKEYFRLKKLIALKSNQIKNVKESLLLFLQNKVEANIQTNGKHHIRELNENQVSSKNEISINLKSHVSSFNFTRHINGYSCQYLSSYPLTARLITSGNVSTAMPLTS